jgi:Cu/Ag efflux protein CusF
MNVPGMTGSYLVKDRAVLSNLQPMQEVGLRATRGNRTSSSWKR